jgi:hypothetical protein
MKKISLSALIFLAVFVFISRGALAYKIETLDGFETKNDFVLGPGKTELFMSAGEGYTKDLIITNRLGKTMKFNVEVEDFSGSKDPEQTVVLSGDEKGPYSLRDYLKPEISSFTLENGQRITLPVTVSIPQDAEPGGLYGSVLVTSSPTDEQAAAEKDKAQGQTKLISRLGTLFFVRVKGDAKEEGLLKDFRVKGQKKFFEKSPVNLEILYENTGNVHLVPYGTIEVTNILGRKIDELNIDPWFVMPGSSRIRNIEWKNDRFLFGIYHAKLSMNRGYGDLIDQKSLTFWVIPWKIAIIVLVAIFILAWFFRWIKKQFKFEIRRK